MSWYENEKDLETAISFILKYDCCFGWNAFASAKTPCCDYATEDINIPEGLKEAIRGYYRNLTKEERRELNGELSLLLGERFYVKEDSIVKILSRILCDGNPVDNKNMIAASLQIQIKQRMKLLESLMVS